MPDEAKIAAGLALLREGMEGIGGECPCCGSVEVQCNDYEGGHGDILYEKASCTECGASWKNHYEIFNRELLEGSTSRTPDGPGIIPGGGLSEPVHMSDEQYEEFKRTPEGANELSRTSDPDISDDDRHDQEGPTTYYCGGCGREFFAPPYENPYTCPYNDLIDNAICPECAEKCPDCHKGELICQESD